MAFPPFMNSMGLIGKIFEKMQQAKVPPRYTQDFQSTVLGFGSGSARVPTLSKAVELHPKRPRTGATPIHRKPTFRTAALSRGCVKTSPG